MRLRRRMLSHIEADIRDHIERETRDNIERGMMPDEARYAAMRKFGNAGRVMEETRAVWRRVWIEQLLQDLRHGFRTLRKNPGFALAAILTIALGVGMNAAIFSVVNSVLLRPLAYPNPERLVWLADYDPNIKRDVAMGPDFFSWREQAQSYTAMAAYGYQQAAIATTQDANQVNGVAIGGDFWPITGARPALGRLFGPKERRSVVLAWNLFESQFHGDAHIVGSTILLDGRPAIITGVLPKNFRFQFPIWWQSSQRQPVEAFLPLDEHDFRMVNIVAALRPDVSTGQALSELKVMDKRTRENRALPPRLTSPHLRVEPLREKLSGDSRPALLVLLAAGAFVLLIAAVNIANLLLARATARQREIAVRAAMGAGRARMIRQMLSESVLLSLIGGACGLVLAAWTIAILVRLSPNAIPRLAETTIDGWVLAFTLAVSIGVGLLFGAGPAFTLAKTNLHDALKEGSRTSTGASGVRIRRLLVAGELALAIVLLTGAGLMMKSFWRMYQHPPGFAPESVLLLSVRLAGTQYNAMPAQETYMRELLRRVESTPGAEASGLSTWFLWSGAPAFPADASPQQTHVIRLHAISPGYPRAMGMRLVRGRWLTDGDATATMLNESMARQAFGAADPIGRIVSIPRPLTVVGVVADLKYSKLDAEAPPEAFIPYGLSPMLRFMDVVVRTTNNPAMLAPALRKQISEIDPAQPVFDVRTLEHALMDSIAPRRFNLFLLGTFAAVALTLALVGIYGVIAYSVSERRREIGVRMAIGAQRNQVVRMVVAEGMSVALVGIAIGLAAALGLTRLMASLLYDVKPNDPLTFATAAFALAAAALAACWGPALKAATVDPTIALRYE